MERTNLVYGTSLTSKVFGHPLRAPETIYDPMPLKKDADERNQVCAPLA